jgi:hypothetical protein
MCDDEFAARTQTRTSNGARMVEHAGFADDAARAKPDSDLAPLFPDDRPPPDLRVMVKRFDPCA